MVSDISTDYINTYIMCRVTDGLKRIRFVGSSLNDLRTLPRAAKHAIGLDLMRVQYGGTPMDFKPMPTVGAGAYEIRIRRS